MPSSSNATVEDTRPQTFCMELPGHQHWQMVMKGKAPPPAHLMFSPPPRPKLPKAPPPGVQLLVPPTVPPLDLVLLRPCVQQLEPPPPLGGTTSPFNATSPKPVTTAADVLRVAVATSKGRPLDATADASDFTGSATAADPDVPPGSATADAALACVDNRGWILPNLFDFLVAPCNHPTPALLERPRCFCWVAFGEHRGRRRR